MRSAILVAAMAGTTVLLRFLPDRVKAAIISKLYLPE